MDLDIERKRVEAEIRTSDAISRITEVQEKKISKRSASKSMKSKRLRVQQY